MLDRSYILPRQRTSNQRVGVYGPGVKKRTQGGRQRSPARRVLGALALLVVIALPIQILISAIVPQSEVLPTFTDTGVDTDVDTGVDTGAVTGADTVAIDSVDAAAKPIAQLVVVSEGNLQQMGLIDQSGVVYSLVTPENFLQLPIVRGIEYANFSIGVRLPQQLTGIIQSLTVLENRQPQLYKYITDIHLNNYVGGKIIPQLYVRGVDIPVIFDEGISPQKLENLFVLLATVALDSQEIEKIDIRGGDTILQYRQS